MATNPVVSLPDADKVKAALERLRVRRGVRCHGQHRHRGARARAAAGARLGREGRHGHQLRSHDLAAARVPAAARRSARGLAHRLRRGARHGLRRLRLHFAARDLPRARAAHGACQRRQARAESRRLGQHHGRRIQELGARGLAHGRVARFGARADVRRRQIPASRRQGALHRADAAPARTTRRRRNSRWCSTPAACAITGTP